MTEPFDLVTARINKGLSQRDLADTVGVNRDTIFRLENGLRVRPSNAKKVADYFDVQVTDLMPVAPKAAA